VLLHTFTPVWRGYVGSGLQPTYLFLGVWPNSLGIWPKTSSGAARSSPTGSRTLQKTGCRLTDEAECQSETDDDSSGTDNDRLSGHHDVTVQNDVAVQNNGAAAQPVVDTAGEPLNLLPGHLAVSPTRRRIISHRSPLERKRRFSTDIRS